MKNKFQRIICLMRQILRKMRVPLYFHPRSKHTFTVHQHVIMLVLRQYCSTSYEEFVQWLAASSDVARWLGLRSIPHFTTPHKAAARIGASLLHIVTGRFAYLIGRPELAGMDGTGFEDRHSTPYYTYRARLHRSYIKMSCASDLKTQVVLSCAISHRPIHDTKHVSHLLRRMAVVPRIILLDKAYDSERVHTAIRRYGSHAIIPVRGDRPTCRTRGVYRKQMRRSFDYATYGQRSKCETVFSVIKRRFGSEVRSHHDLMKEKELLYRVLAYNSHRMVMIFCLTVLMISREPLSQQT
jgi:hypothetical protein